MTEVINDEEMSRINNKIKDIQEYNLSKKDNSLRS